MKFDLKKLNLRQYLSKELLYLTIGIGAYLLYKYLVHDLSVHKFIRTNIFHLTNPRPGEITYVQMIIWFTTSFFYLFIIPFIAGLIIEGKNVWTKFGLKLPNAKKGLLMTAALAGFMFICILIAVKIFPGFGKYYPMAKFAKTSISIFIVYEICYFLYFIGWEFFFHSFMLFPYEKKFGKAGAILIGAMPFVILHIGKPFPEVLGSFVAGIALSILALETRSFWYGVFLHGLVAVFMDIAVVLLIK